MLELDLSRKLGISLDEVYQLSSEFHRIFDSFEEIIQEQKQEYEDEITRLQEERDSFENDGVDYEYQLANFESDLDKLQSENNYLKDLLIENGIDYRE